MVEKQQQQKHNTLISQREERNGIQAESAGLSLIVTGVNAAPQHQHQQQFQDTSRKHFNILPRHLRTAFGPSTPHPSTSPVQEKDISEEIVTRRDGLHKL